MLMVVGLAVVVAVVVAVAVVLCFMVVFLFSRVAAVCVAAVSLLSGV